MRPRAHGQRWTVWGARHLPCCQGGEENGARVWVGFSIWEADMRGRLSKDFCFLQKYLARSSAENSRWKGHRPHVLSVSCVEPFWVQDRAFPAFWMDHAAALKSSVPLLLLGQAHQSGPSVLSLLLFFSVTTCLGSGHNQLRGCPQTARPCRAQP